MREVFVSDEIQQVNENKWPIYTNQMTQANFDWKREELKAIKEPGISPMEFTTQVS